MTGVFSAHRPRQFRSAPCLQTSRRSASFRRDAVSAAQGEGAFPVTLGGDHALGLGTVAGTAQHYSPEELSLVWVDAHTDINTENSSLSGNIHGMPIAALLGLCGQELSSVCGGLPALRPENVHIIFARDIDPAEERIIAEQGVHLYRMSEVKEQGLSAVLHRLLGEQQEAVSFAASQGAVIGCGSDAGAYRVFHGRGAQDEHTLLTEALGADAPRLLAYAQGMVERKFRFPG